MLFASQKFGGSTDMDTVYPNQLKISGHKVM